MPRVIETLSKQPGQHEADAEIAEAPPLRGPGMPMANRNRPGAGADGAAVEEEQAWPDQDDEMEKRRLEEAERRRKVQEFLLHPTMKDDLLLLFLSLEPERVLMENLLKQTGFEWESNNCKPALGRKGRLHLPLPLSLSLFFSLSPFFLYLSLSFFPSHFSPSHNLSPVLCFVASLSLSLFFSLSLSMSLVFLFLSLSLFLSVSL